MATVTAGQAAGGTPGLDRIFPELQSKNKDVRNKAAHELRESLITLLRGKMEEALAVDHALTDRQLLLQNSHLSDSSNITTMSRKGYRDL